MAVLDVHTDTTTTVLYEYILHVPAGVWVFQDLQHNAQPTMKTAGPYYPVDRIPIAVDLITAARLRLIKPGDDSGVTTEQWAWLKLLGLTGESK